MLGGRLGSAPAETNLTWHGDRGTRGCAVANWCNICLRKNPRKTPQMAALDWSQCQAVETVPDRMSGAWVFRGTRMPVATVFENLEAGATVEQILEWFDISREQVNAVLDFAARSLETPVHR
jgi:uncharacterized protein (DUF433 family)